MLETSRDKETEILRHAERFLQALTEYCLKECGGKLSPLEFPVFKKFLNYRIRREIEFNRLCLIHAAVLNETGTEITGGDLEELYEESRLLDGRLMRDIRFLPFRITMNYDEIRPLRMERIRKLVSLFQRLLSVDSPSDYPDMVRKAMSREEYLNINDEIVELYAEEAYIINSSIHSFFKTDTRSIAERMYCSMIDVGFTLNRKVAQEIYGTQVS